MSDENTLRFEPLPIIREFFKVDRLHHQCIDKKVSSMGCNLHRNQHAILMFLSRSGSPASQKDIAESFDISAAAVANSVKILENAGYIARVTDSADSRRNLVSLTDEGKEIIRKTHTHFEEVDKRMLVGFSEEEVEIFRNCLVKIYANLKEFYEEESK